MTEQLLLDKIRIVRYWLGQMSPDEEIDFEVACFSDNTQTEWCNIVRTGLIDLYVRGKLQGDNRRCFEEHFLQDPHHQELVNFAHTNQPTIVPVPDVVPPTIVPVSISWGERLRRFFAWETLSGPSLAMAAGLLLTVGGLSFVTWRAFFTTPTSAPELVARATPTPNAVVVPTGAPPTPAPPTPKPQPTASAQSSTAPTPAALPTPMPRATPVAPTPPTSESDTVAQLNLFRSLVKKGSNDATEGVLEIKPTTKEIIIKLPNPQDCRQCQAVIKRQSPGGSVLPVPLPRPLPKGDRLVLKLDVQQLSADKFPAGDYVLELAGQDNRGQPVTIPWLFALVR